MFNQPVGLEIIKTSRFSIETCHIFRRGKLKKGDTGRRWQTAIKDKAFDGICRLPVLETRPEQFLHVLENGTVSTSVYLRRLHNFALDMTWLPWPVIVKRQWPEIRFKEKLAITLEEHRRIVEREKNPECKVFYKLAWHLGASQSDLAFLETENVDWENHVISFARKKTGSIAIMRFGDDVAENTLFSGGNFVDLSEFSGRSAMLKFVNGLLGEILPTGYVNCLKPTFFSPAPSSTMGYSDLFEPFGKTDNCRGSRLCIGIKGIHMRAAAFRFWPVVFVWVCCCEIFSSFSSAGSST